MTTGKPCSAPSVSPAATAASAALAPILGVFHGQRHDGIEFGVETLDRADVRVQYFYRARLPRSDEAYEFDRGAVVERVS